MGISLVLVIGGIMAALLANKGTLGPSQSSTSSTPQFHPLPTTSTSNNNNNNGNNNNGGSTTSTTTSTTTNNPIVTPEAPLGTITLVGTLGAVLALFGLVRARTHKRI